MAEREGAAHGGLLHSIRHFGAALLAAGQTRLEILATEIEEERMRLEQLLLLALAAAFCLGMGLVLVVAFIVIYFWDTHRLLTVGVLALAFLSVAAACATGLYAKLKSRPKPFAVTRGELAKDVHALREPPP